MDIGGNADGLSGMKLIIAIVVNFLLGALMTVGVGYIHHVWHLFHY